MKRVLFTLAVILPMLLACSSPEKKAQNLITNHLKETIVNFDRYNPLSWGELEPVDVLIEHYDEYLMAKRNVETQEGRIKEMDDMIKKALELGMSKDDVNVMRMESEKETVERRARTAEAEVKAVVSAFPYIDGYSMKHSYEWVNALGETVKTDEIFYFDKDLKKVVCTEK